MKFPENIFSNEVHSILRGLNSLIIFYEPPIWSEQEKQYLGLAAFSVTKAFKYLPDLPIGELIHNPDWKGNKAKERLPQVGDWVVPKRYLYILQKGELYQIELIQEHRFRVNGVNHTYAWDEECFRFATPEEISAQEPVFDTGDIVVSLRNGKISEVTASEMEFCAEWGEHHRHATEAEKAKFRAENQTPVIEPELLFTLNVGANV